MVRTGLLVGLSIGIVSLPDGSSLLPFAVVAGLFAISHWWKRQPANRVRLPARILSQPPHYHYCVACDQQWRHEEPDCIAHWASHCLMCAEPPGRQVTS